MNLDQNMFVSKKEKVKYVKQISILPLFLYRVPEFLFFFFTDQTEKRNKELRILSLQIFQKSEAMWEFLPQRSTSSIRFYHRSMLFCEMQFKTHQKRQKYSLQIKKDRFFQVSLGFYSICMYMLGSWKCIHPSFSPAYSSAGSKGLLKHA